jgi:hypothetical protein
MGDKSPKAMNKHATQKQTKANSDQQKKQQTIAAKQMAGKKN